MKKIVGIGLLVMLTAFIFLGCETDQNDNFIPVADIIDVQNQIPIGSTFLMSGTVEPYNATNKNIVWSVKNANNTGATINGGDNLNVTDFGTNWGDFLLTATIHNGLGNNKDYTKDFPCNVIKYNKITNTIYFISNKGDFGSSNNADVRFIDFYQGNIKKNTNYKVTVNGTLDKDVGFLGVYFVLDNPFIYLTNTPALQVQSGQIHQLEYILTTNNIFEVFTDTDTIKVEFYFGFSSDPSNVSDANAGKISASITNFSMTIIEFNEELEGEPIEPPELVEPDEEELEPED
ncbi:MAG: hypothetical protein FWB86_12295 [Treponema sp.]|nr:hypothetical protein [Treponema sp.]MCL2251067.1 hypothetical protein [Treponema sp.]MCL2251664.1 hypothetical protein [Treponema sp.]